MKIEVELPDPPVGMQWKAAHALALNLANDEMRSAVQQWDLLPIPKGTVTIELPRTSVEHYAGGVPYVSGHGMVLQRACRNALKGESA